MSRPTPFDFTQFSNYAISKVKNYMIVGLDKDGRIHEDITNPGYEAWFLFRLDMSAYALLPSSPAATIYVLTNGDYWYKIEDWRIQWQSGPDDNYLSQLKLVGVDNKYQSQINLHQNDKAAINAIIKDAMQKEKYSL